MKQLDVVVSPPAFLWNPYLTLTFLWDPYLTLTNVIFDLDICDFWSNELFSSHRRTDGRTDRQTEGDA